jgi:hypothetical protein
MLAAAEKLQEGFENVAKRLVKALNEGKHPPRIMRIHGQPPIAIYTIRWSSSTLRPMHAAVQFLGGEVGNDWFSDIFQYEASRQLQGCRSGDEPNDAFVFSLNYGETWEQWNERLALEDLEGQQ